MATFRSLVEPSYSYDGTRMVYLTEIDFMPDDANGRIDIYLVDLIDGITIDYMRGRTLVSVSTSGAQHGGTVADARFSPDGTRIVFTSTSTFGDITDTNGMIDVFVRDLVTNTTTRLSTDSGGAQLISDYSGDHADNPVFSPDGAYLMFDAQTHGVAYQQI
jgi:Tol biopolymer transport system component